jgi:hypothetical protein
MPGQVPGIRSFEDCLAHRAKHEAAPDRALPSLAGNCYVHAEAGSIGCDSVTGARVDSRRQEYPMKTSVLGLALVMSVVSAMSVVSTVPAAARGGSAGWPGTVGPSYPYPSYCEICGAPWVAAPPPSRVVVRHYKPRPRAN